MINITQVSLKPAKEFGTGHYLWRGVTPKIIVFRGKKFADPTSRKFDYPTSNVN
jgi:hypothetical protein